MSLFDTVFNFKQNLTPIEAHKIALGSFDIVQLTDIKIDVTKYRYYDFFKTNKKTSEIHKIILLGQVFTSTLFSSSFILNAYLTKNKIFINSKDECWEVLKNNQFVKDFIELLEEDLRGLDNKINIGLNMEVIDGNAEARYNFMIISYLKEVHNAVHKIFLERENNYNSAAYELAYNLLFNSGVIKYETGTICINFTSAAESIWVKKYLTDITVNVDIELKNFNF